MEDNKEVKVIKVVLHGKVRDVIRGDESYEARFQGEKYELVGVYGDARASEVVKKLKLQYGLRLEKTVLEPMPELDDEDVELESGDDIEVGINNQRRPVDGEMMVEYKDIKKESEWEGPFSIDALLDMGYEAAGILACISGEQKTHKKKNFRKAE